MITFFRGQYAEAVLEIHSSEELGLINTGFLEDAYGTDGQISVRNMDTGIRYPLLMAEVSDGGPPHDYFRGYLPLASVPNGPYALDFRVQDPRGNVTIVGALETGGTADRYQSIEFAIAPGFGVSIKLPSLHMIRAPTLVVPTRAAHLYARAPRRSA